MDPVIFFSVFLVSVFLLKWLKKSLQRPRPLPPGPKGYPFIGNLLQMPSTTPWKTFDEWSKIYGMRYSITGELCFVTHDWTIGDTIYLDLPNQPTVVLNSASAATDLLEKRSDIYSDRPISVMQRLLVFSKISVSLISCTLGPSTLECSGTGTQVFSRTLKAGGTIVENSINSSISTRWPTTCQSNFANVVLSYAECWTHRRTLVHMFVSKFQGHDTSVDLTNAFSVVWSQLSYWRSLSTRMSPT